MSKKHVQKRCTHVVTADGNQTLANQSMREAQAKQTLKGAFGTNNRRDLNLLKYQGTASNSPGPGTYDPGKWHPEPVTGNISGEQTSGVIKTFTLLNSFIFFLNQNYHDAKVLFLIASELHACIIIFSKRQLGVHLALPSHRPLAQ